MISVCLPSDALLQHLPSYLGFSYLGCGVSLHAQAHQLQGLHRSVAERSYPSPKVRGGSLEEPPHVRGQGQRPRGATPLPRSGAVAETSYPTSKERQLPGCRRAERSYSIFKVKRGGHEEIPLVQGKEQRLCFAGAAMKRT